VGPESKRLPALAAWNAAAAFLALLAPHLAYLAYHSYDLASVELGALAAALGLAAALVSLIAWTSRGTWRSLVFAAVILVSVELMVDLPEVGWRLRWIALATFVGCWALRRELPKFLVAIFLVFNVTTIFQSRLPRGIALAAAPARTDLPLLVHLVLDSHEGLDAFAGGSDGAALRESLLARYERRGFRVFGAAYSRYFMTKNSLGNMLNFTAKSRDHAYFESERSPRLLANAYFERLRQQGFEVRVLQSSWLDFCSAAELPPSACRSYAHAGLRAIADVEAGGICKALVLERMLLQRSTLVKWIRRRWPAVWVDLSDRNRIACRDRLPDWLFRPSELPSLASFSGLEVLEQVASEVRAATPGTALFAHVILPHSPFFFGPDCTVLPAASWMERGGTGPRSDDSTWEAERIDAYHDQVRCLHSRLERLLDELEDRPEPVWVVLHGDHGSRVVRRQPIDQDPNDVAPFDLVHSFSAWFAVKAPHVARGYEPGPAPLEELLLATVVERRLPKSGDVPTVFLERRQQVDMHAVVIPAWTEMLAALSGEPTPVRDEQRGSPSGAPGR
jgi:hypothetical protein